MPTGRVLTLSYDDPQTVAADRLRSDGCVVLRTEEERPLGIELGAVCGGRCVVYRLDGSHREFRGR